MDVYSPPGKNWSNASAAEALLLKLRPSEWKKCFFRLLPRSSYAARAAFASRCTSAMVEPWPHRKVLSSGFFDSRVRVLMNFLKRFVLATTLFAYLH